MATVAHPQQAQQDEVNPLTEGLERLPVHPTTLVIFGATGDLAKRKLLPALYNLAHEGALPERFNLIGVSRGDIGDEGLQQLARESIAQFSRRPPDDKVLDSLVGGMRYVPGSFDEDGVYDRLGEVASKFDEQAGLAFNRLFYLSTAPSFFPVIAGKLGAHGLSASEGAEVRMIVEKPFGTDLESALSLNRELLSVFDERQIFRIDHYLGKETVQNLLVLRFANGIFEPLWNRSYVDCVQITAAEDIGIGTRAGYYDKSGALGVAASELVLSVHPNEGVSLSLEATIPGARLSVSPVNMEFLYVTSFMSQTPEAYQRLILDTMRGDATLFARNDEVEAAWGICDPILQAWGEMDGELPKYPSGTPGPLEADALLEPGHRWRAI